MTDPIADMLTRVRNALAVNIKEVILPYSNIKFSIAELLVKEGYLESAEKMEDKLTGFDQIKIVLKYEGRRQPKIKHIQRVSKPGCRIYAKKDEMPYVLNNIGIAVISTSKGLMTNKKAKKEGYGGEIICEIW
ncbi:MAG: 30S ribosomal protein S8 [Patescibacteria group bacterium]